MKVPGKTLVLLVILLGHLLPAHAQEVKPWYEQLRPGVTRSEVLNLAGRPTFSDADLDTYKQAKGRMECRYKRGILDDLTYYDPPGGGVSESIYWTGREPEGNAPAARQHYLQDRQFATLPRFGGTWVHTRKYRGRCYEVDGQFLVVEPIIALGGGMGFFADKTARLLLVHADGREETLYRAADHWADLRPPGLAPAEAVRRTQWVRRMGKTLDDLPKIGMLDRLRPKVGASVPMTSDGLAKIGMLGRADSSMGSGVDYRLFYLEDALLTVACDSVGSITYASLVRPGLDAAPTFDDYSRSTPKAAPTIASPPPALP